MKYIVFLTALLLFACGPTEKTNTSIIYASDHLIVKQITANVYEHTSFLKTKSFGKVPCNGMIITDNNEAIVFDTTIDEKTSRKLLKIIAQKLNCKVKAVVATHFHEDCVGGLDAFHKHSIPSYAQQLTLELTKKNDVAVPQNSIDTQHEFQIGNQKVYARYFGEGHTRDNIVGYFPAEKVLFGGCLIKENGAGKGNLEDANVKDWPETVRKLKAAYPDAVIIIPGHGKTGGRELLDYTIQLFEE